MYSYSFYEWIALFYFYSFFGWCFECVYVSVRKRKLVNRGFMRGPFLPLYGSGAIMMLVVSAPFKDNIILTFIAGCIGATILEYITGYCMEMLFKVRYWDYSTQKWNFQGHICLGTSLMWGGLTILMTKILHPIAGGLLFHVQDRIILIAVVVLSVIISYDFIRSFVAAIEIRNILVHMGKVKEEFVHLTKRVDATISLLEEAKDGYLEEFEKKITESLEQMKESANVRKQTSLYRVEELQKSIETKLANLKTMVNSKKPEYQDELNQLDQKYMDQVEKDALLKIKNRRHLNKIFMGNPTMISKYFKSSLEELKDSIIYSKKEKKQSSLEGNKEDTGVTEES